MFKHECKERGKRLSETTAACPKCGISRPPSSWDQIPPATRFPVIATKVVLFLLCGYATFAAHPQISGKESLKTAAATSANSDLKLGDLFDFTVEGAYACRSAREFVEISRYIADHDQANVNRMLDKRRASPCFNVFPANVHYVVDRVDNYGKVNLVNFHSTSSIPSTYLYTLQDFIKARTASTLSPGEQDPTLPDTRPGQFFSVRTNESFACATKENLSKIMKYKHDGDQTNAKKLLIEYGGQEKCFSTSLRHVFYVLDEVEKVDGIRGSVVKFHRFGSFYPMPLYAPIAFVGKADYPATVDARSVTETKIKPGLLFSVHQGEFVACESTSDLAKFNQYETTDQFLAFPSSFDGDKYSKKIDLNRLGRADIHFCYGNDLIQLNAQFKIDNIKRVKGIDEDVVAIHRVDTESSVILYTTYQRIHDHAKIESVNASSPAASTAN
ncbi:MAG: hypothetical protein P4L91_06860 [Burkholderiaceae bacterium]|nr:hypothetical protein [Burkholderiaceae bacterium]